MKYEGEKAMKSVVLTAIMALLLGVSCANSEQSVYLEKFIPLSSDTNCAVTTESKLWYDTGYIDIYFTDQYYLPFKIINEMAVSATAGMGAEGAPIASAEANQWKLKYVILDFEMPPINFPPTVMDPANWQKRKVISQAIVDNNGGAVAGAVQLFTNEQHADLLAIFATFASMGQSFDWETYPIVVTMQAEGEKQGGGDTIYTNKLKFRVIPVYGDMVRAGAIYPDGNWPTDEQIEADNPLPADQEQKKYERDQEIYETMIQFCDFSAQHLTGCLIGQDYGLVDCYTYGGAYDAIEALFPSHNCCPKEKPTEPTEPTTTPAF